jgi:hypothetical protein
MIDSLKDSDDNHVVGDPLVRVNESLPTKTHSSLMRWTRMLCQFLGRRCNIPNISQTTFLLPDGGHLQRTRLYSSTIWALAEICSIALHRQRIFANCENCLSQRGSGACLSM